jgi:hypothetical protein
LIGILIILPEFHYDNDYLETELNVFLVVDISAHKFKDSGEVPNCKNL